MELTSIEAARAADISYRQLDYWTRTDVVTPSGRVANGSGSRRRWTFHDVARLVVLGRLRSLVPDTAPLEAAWRALADVPVAEWMGKTLTVDTRGTARLWQPATVHVAVPLGECALAADLAVREVDERRARRQAELARVR